MKHIVSLMLLIVVALGFCSPALALITEAQKQRPYLYKEYVKIEENSCVATAIIPYSGLVLYQCPTTHEEFWSKVLVPSTSSPLFMYFKNRKKANDELVDDVAASTMSSAAMIMN